MSFDTINSAIDLLPDYEGLFFLGKVIDNSDPLNLGRIRAQIQGLYDSSFGELPWCGPKKASPFGIGPTWGVFGSPAIGSDVRVTLQNGDPHYPEYEPIQANPPDSEFPTGGASWGFKDPYGNVLKVLQNKTVEFRAAAGVTLNISPAGSLSVTSVADLTINTSGDLSINSGGSTTINSGGDFSVTAPRIDWNKS